MHDTLAVRDCSGYRTKKLLGTSCLMMNIPTTFHISHVVQEPRPMYSKYVKITRLYIFHSTLISEFSKFQHTTNSRVN